jgi:hypothetical protein
VRFVFLLAAFAAALYAQANVAQLYSAGRYDEVVAATSNESGDADTLFLRGMSLARLNRWDEADSTLRRGQSLAPRDPRFPTELAGVSYRLEDFRRSRKLLRRALQLEPEDEYARNFLGSLYLLDGNLDAALTQWNRIDQPRLASVELPGGLRTDPVLLDRALAFSPASTLQLSELRTSRARLNLLDAFSSYAFDLVPEPAAKATSCACGAPNGAACSGLRCGRCFALGAAFRTGQSSSNTTMAAATRRVCTRSPAGTLTAGAPMSSIRAPSSGRLAIVGGYSATPARNAGT